MPSRDTVDSPFQLERAAGRRAVVLTCEHADNQLPVPQPDRREERRVLRDHWGWDPGAWRTTRALARGLDAPAIGGRWSRLWLDLNRHVADPTLVRDEVEGVRLSFNDGVDDDEVHRRVDAIHAPYHEAVDREIRRRLVQGVRPALIAVHSFTRVYAGRVRDFEVGILYHSHDGPARRLIRALRAAGLEVRANQPYSGKRGMMYSAQRHGSHHGLVCLEVELNQALFDRGGDASRVIDALLEALDGLVDDWVGEPWISGGSADSPGPPVAPRPSSRARRRSGS